MVSVKTPFFMCVSMPVINVSGQCQRSMPAVNGVVSAIVNAVIDAANLFPCIILLASFSLKKCAMPGPIEKSLLAGHRGWGPAENRHREWKI